LWASFVHPSPPIEHNKHVQNSSITYKISTKENIDHCASHQRTIK